MPGNLTQQEFDERVIAATALANSLNDGRRKMEDLSPNERETVEWGIEQSVKLFRAFKELADNYVANMQEMADAVVAAFSRTTNHNLPRVSAPVPVDGWHAADVIPDDAMAIDFEGLPGMATHCWADEWNPITNRYNPCNEDISPDSGEIGVCERHLAIMKSRA